MPAVRPPTFWLWMAAATISAVAVVCMVAAGGTRRPLDFAGAILLPDSRAGSSMPSPAAGRPSAPARPTVARSAAPVLAGPSGYQPPVTRLTPAASSAWSSSVAPAVTSKAGTPVPVASSRTPAPRTSVPAAPQGESGPDALAQALVTALNEARRQAGRAGLAWNGRLHRIAAGHNQSMARAGLLTSRVGDEPALGVRQANQGVLGDYAAEVEGRTTLTGTAGALAVLRSMLAEQAPDDSRRRCLLSGGVNSIGLDVLADAAHGQLWITVDVAQLS
ncbi:MAG: hypothetical protein JO144_08390 [Actinobacteria bacterium]|nr:hypothetical protein [Actinomycetota bacterium]